MYLAQNAKEDSMKIPLGRKSGWTIFHTLELKYVERKIRKATTRGKTSIKINYIGELVKVQLEKNGYRVVFHEANFINVNVFWLIDWG